MIGIRKEMTEERDDRKALLIILPATTLLVFISIDTIHFHSITNINMAEPNPNPSPLPEPNPNPTPLLQLLRRKTAAIGRRPWSFPPHDDHGPKRSPLPCNSIVQ